MIVLDGRPLAKQIRGEVKLSAQKFRNRGIIPTLVIVVPTDDGMTDSYVKSIIKAAGSCDIEARVVKVSGKPTTESIAKMISALAKDNSVHGIILQTPLPKGVNVDDLAKLIPPAKDVDGVSPLSAGQTLFGQDAFAPATAEAVMRILEAYQIPLEGKHAVVVGRSRVVGKPVAHLLTEQHATVTLCHSRTKGLQHHTKQADVLIVAVGQPGIITKGDISPGAVVVDVGINVTKAGGIIGDVAEDVASVAGALTPVPGGVGPVTTALILQHTIKAIGKRPNSTNARIAILASGSGTTAEEVIRQTVTGKVGYEVGLVICSRQDAGIFARVASLNAELGTDIPCMLINHQTHPSGDGEVTEKGCTTLAEEQAIIEAIKTTDVDLVVLLGYMKRVGPNIVKQFGWQNDYDTATKAMMLNTHPGLLPATKGTYGIYAQERTLELGLKESGQTLHIVAEDYDDGPVVAEHRVPVEKADTPETLFARVQVVEKQFIAQDIDNFIKQRLKGD